MDEKQLMDKARQAAVAIVGASTSSGGNAKGITMVAAGGGLLFGFTAAELQSLAAAVSAAACAIVAVFGFVASQVWNWRKERLLRDAIRKGKVTIQG